MNKVMNAQISATRCWSGAGAKRLRSPQKIKNHRRGIAGGFGGLS
jgi:hypothetical protein